MFHLTGVIKYGSVDIDGDSYFYDIRFKGLTGYCIGVAENKRALGTL